MKVYDHHFNANEWFVIGALCVGVVVVCVLPRRFPPKRAVIYYMTGVFCGFFFDHTLSVIPVSFYDVNDTSQFQFIDFLSYWMYGPVSYLFFYVYGHLDIKPVFNPLYILCWSSVSVGVEWVAVRVGVFHYQNGYNLGYSFPIYLLVQSVWLLIWYKTRDALDTPLQRGL